MASALRGPGPTESPARGELGLATKLGRGSSPADLVAPPRAAGAGSPGRERGVPGPRSPELPPQAPRGPRGGAASAPADRRRRTPAVSGVGARAGGGASPSRLGAASEITTVYLRSQPSSLINYRASALVYSFCAGEKRIIYGPPNWV